MASRVGQAETRDVPWPRPKNPSHTVPLRRAEIHQGHVRRRAWSMASEPVRASPATTISSCRPSISCTDFHGFDIVPSTAHTIEVTVTNLEIAEENVPCTRDLPQARFPSCTNFVAGQAYEVLVNSAVIETFTQGRQRDSARQRPDERNQEQGHQERKR